MRIDDTVRLLGECSLNSKNAVSAIDEICTFVDDPHLLRELQRLRCDNEKLGIEADAMLASYHLDGREPSAMTRGMAKARINLKMAAEPGDKTAAGLAIDSISSGIKSISASLNENCAAEPKAMNLAGKLIECSEKAGTALRNYL